MPRSEKPSNWTEAPLPKPLSEMVPLSPVQIEAQNVINNEIMPIFYKRVGLNPEEIENVEPYKPNWVIGSIPKPEK